MNDVDRQPGYPVPDFLYDENPAQERYHEATELFALFDYLKAQRFGVFSIRESLQAVGENRDGTLQGFHLSGEEAWECVRFLERLGLGVVELPAYPFNEYGMASNRRLIEQAREAGYALEFAAHARCVRDDVDAAYEAGFRRVHLYIGTSKIKQAAARASLQQLAEKAFESIRYARERGFSCVRISTEDAFRTDLDDYEAFYSHLHGLLSQQGLVVDGIGIPDTVGLSTLPDLGDRIMILRQVGIRFSFLECHIHNDIGNADRMYVDTLLLCMRMGITMLPDVSILGMGERNGTIGLSSLLEAIYRRLIFLYPRKVSRIRQAMRQTLGTVEGGQLFVNCYRDMDAFFYKITARTGFMFDRSPFSANTEYDGSGVHAATTMAAYQLAREQGLDGQDAVEVGNMAYSGAMPPYDMDLRRPVLACFGCGKSNVRYWREREGLALRPAAEIMPQITHLDEAGSVSAAQLSQESAVDELIARLIRLYSIKENGITHQDAMELVLMFYAPADETAVPTPTLQAQSS